MKENWKDIVGFEGKYQVSNMGRVRSLPHWVNSGAGGRMIKGRILKPNIHNGKSYTSIEIGKGNWRLVHRLVAEAFIPNPYNKPQVNHIDGNKNNPHADNLEWVTGGENMRHAYNVGLQKTIYGAEHPYAWKKIKAINKDGTEHIFKSIKFCCQELGMRYNSVRRVLCGKRLHYHGYKFEYL